MTIIREDVGQRNSQSLLVGDNWPKFSGRQFDIIQERAAIPQVRMFIVFYRQQQSQNRERNHF